MEKKPFATKDQLEAIAAQYPTPFHLYDEAGIRRNMEALRDAFSWNEGYKEYFAVKATPNPFLIKLLHEYGCGCDCSSYTELMLSDACGIRGHDIMFSSNETPGRLPIGRRIAQSSTSTTSRILTSWKKPSAISPKPSAADNPGGLKSATASWTIRAMRNTV
ncbi:MAG: hypothetical protein ACLT98_02090 [Eggerthellaceae bacterium]